MSSQVAAEDISEIQNLEIEGYTPRHGTAMLGWEVTDGEGRAKILLEEQNEGGSTYYNLSMRYEEEGDGILSSEGMGISPGRFNNEIELGDTYDSFENACVQVGRILRGEKEPADF